MIAGRFHFTHSVMNQPGRGREGCVKSTWILKKVPYSTCFEFFTATGTYNIYFFATSVKYLVLHTNNANKFRQCPPHRANRNRASEASYFLSPV